MKPAHLKALGWIGAGIASYFSYLVLVQDAPLGLLALAVIFSVTAFLGADIKTLRLRVEQLEKSSEPAQ